MIEIIVKVRKVLILVVGFGIRMFLVIKVVKKELFFIIDKDGRVKLII